MPKELITYLVKALVDHPEMVHVSEVVGENVIILEVKVAKEDVGKVIGKSGRTVLALRDILAAVAGKGKQRVVLDILE